MPARSLYVLLTVLFLFIPSLRGYTQKVGFLLGTFVSDRWFLDQKYFTDRIEELGGKCYVEMAYDAEEQIAHAKRLIAEGIDVLVIVPLDRERASEIVRLGQKSGVPVISYDRLIVDPGISLYVSFDNEKVGRLQAEYLLSKVPEGKYMLVNGPPTDNNAILFRQGQLHVLEPHIRSGKVKVLKDLVIDNWSEMIAFERVTEYFSVAHETPDVILVANDALANGVIQALPRELLGKILISGQDADLTGIRNILSGNQAFTVYKPLKRLAYTAAEQAMLLARDKPLVLTTSFRSGDVYYPSILLDPMIVDQANYKETVVRDGHISLSEVVRNLGKAFEMERNRAEVSLMQKERALELAQKENQRYMFTGITAFLVISLIGLSFTIYNKQHHNKMLNRQQQVILDKNLQLIQVNERLQQLNKTLTQQKEEIGSQRDAIALQKEKLEETNGIIARQNDEIQNQNQRLEIEVQKRTEELVQHIRQLEQYSFVTAHNLRAPVARIIGLCQLVQYQRSGEDETRSIINQLMQSSQELDLVFKELNAILDIQTFSTEIFSQVNLEEEMESVLDNLKYEIRQSNASVTYDFSEERLIQGIKTYVHSILFNLMSNAIKYRDINRSLVIGVRTCRRDGWIVLSVADNGLGIDKADTDKIFQLYRRVHYHVEGRGVGLYMVKTQVDSLGGKIQVESEPGEGTRILIYLPDALVKA